MNPISCEIVNVLMQNDIEELVSEDTKELMSKNIVECPKCKIQYDK